jgi:hypothetical protein
LASADAEEDEEADADEDGGAVVPYDITTAVLEEYRRTLEERLGLTVRIDS